MILLTIGYYIHTGRLNLWIAGLGVEIVQIICYILLITVTDPIAKYIFVMIATAASQSFFAILWPGKNTIKRDCSIGIRGNHGLLQSVSGSRGERHRQP